MTKPESRISETAVRAVFDTIQEPTLKWNLNILNLVKRVEVIDDEIYVDVNLVTRDIIQIEAFREAVRASLDRFNPKDLHLRIRRVDVSTEGTSAVKHIILVGSGKGGVGKSSIAANIAGGLLNLGCKVGLMDADIYGPSVPTMMGVSRKPEVLPEEYLMPIDAHGIRTMSVGYLVEKSKAIDWRGSVASATLLQFIQRTLWGPLDFLIIDLPPGTGDLQLTLAHRLRCHGVVVVTTPQEVVLGDVRRSVDLFEKRNIPVLGLVENMGYFSCEECGHRNMPFPKSEHVLPGDPLENIDVLATVPLAREIAVASDSGCPISLREDGGQFRELFTRLARQVVINLRDAIIRLAAAEEAAKAELAARLKEAEAAEAAQAGHGAASPG